ncbi:MAG: hypothetical protein HF978_04260 [Desulfobacteraceae bacterium]|nr:hypothetical protein [Desulfobacteraceae bacterium]MBC2754741.1 hypothetical protein [Desulfobacteraceae bacterium]
MSFYRFPKYVSVGEKKARAEKKLKQLRKKNPDMNPVTIDGQSLAKTWWGKAWNKNLEKYADYSNRIGRGRSYVRHGAVLDLQITPGKVQALVHGSGTKPYSVTVDIKAMPKKNWVKIKQACRGKMESMQQLIAGKFPAELGEVFTQKGSGLFPVPDEITFECSCPDWAVMCKHVAATLYGIGARLDEYPHLFFLLRKVNIHDLVSEAVRESKKELLSKAKKKTSRVIEDDGALSDIFGIDLGGEEKLKGLKKKSRIKRIKVKKTVSQKSLKAKTAKPAAKKKSKKITTTRVIEQIIKRRKKGIPVSEIIDKSGFEDQKARNIIYRLKQQEKIKSISYGIYQWIES